MSAIDESCRPSAPCGSCDHCADDVSVGELVLDDVAMFLGRFVAFPSAAAQTAVTLWVAHCHMVDTFESSPRLALLSPEPGSGKTRVLEVVELLAPRPQHILNASVAAVFRMIEAFRPTLLLDEVDAIFGRRGKDDPSEELRGLLNSGHRSGATIPRCVGPTHQVENFPVFAPVALAGLGDLPATLMSRSVVVRMRRRAPTEKVEPLRRRLAGPEGHALRSRLAAWAEMVAEDCGAAWPEMPPGIEDRPADVWEPLLAVADAARGVWPKLARDACLDLNKVRAEAPSLGVKLLDDIRAVMAGDRATTADLVAKLNDLDESPWGGWNHGDGINARDLARKLKPYDIAPKVLKLAPGSTARGYRAEDFADAWKRYLAAEPPERVTGDTDVTEHVSPTSTVTQGTLVTQFGEAGTL